MPLGSGRKVDNAWCEVLKIESSSKVNCKHCYAEISGKIERIKAHLQKCCVNPEFLPFVMSFKIKDEDIYPSNMFTTAMISNYDASKWWLIVQKKAEKSRKLPTEFCLLMRNLHSAPKSSASLERIFSTFGHVWSKLRRPNRLILQTDDKLNKIYKNKIRLINDYFLMFLLF